MHQMPHPSLFRHYFLVCILVFLATSTSCGSHQPAPISQSSPSIGPARIAAEEIHSLFEPGFLTVQSEKQNMYSSATPPECRSLVLEVDSPLLMQKPLSIATVIAPKPHDATHPRVVQIAAIYGDEFSSRALIAHAVQIREQCRNSRITGSTQGGGTSVFQLMGEPHSGSPSIVLWNLSAVGKSWHCSNALVSTHNVAVEMTSCYPTPASGMDQLALSVLNRINKLAN